MLEADTYEGYTESLPSETPLSVTHFQLFNNRFVTTKGPHPFAYTYVQLSKLIHLAAGTTRAFLASLEGSRRQAAFFVPCDRLDQLERVYLDDYFPFWLVTMNHIAASLTELATLVFSDSHGPSTTALPDLLERLPRSLAILDLAIATVDVAIVDRLRSMFTSECASVRELKLLRLARFGGEAGPGGMKLVALAAEERGVKVEWVDLVAGRSG